MTTPRRTAATLTLALTAALTLSACTTTQPAGSDVVGEGYVYRVMSWTDGSRYAVALNARPEGGVVVLCGAWTALSETSSASQEISLAMRTRVGVRHGVRNFVSNFSGFAGPYSGRQLAGKEARCVRTGVAWSETFEDADGWALTSPRTIITG